jgi:pimeloyl-ACP methyl ester carboxylesterase
MPVASLAQDWGGQLGFDPDAIWRAWAADFAFHPIQAGHFMAESHPTEVAQFIRTLTKR